jgi:polyferredoxin
MLKKLSFWNTFSRILLLLLTPAFFRWFNFAFIWHSIYWGVVSVVVMIWLGFILLSPLFGRIGCGWFCFVGTTQDLPFGYAVRKLKKRKPFIWLRLLAPVAFLATSVTFFVLRIHGGEISGIRFAPGFFTRELNSHYQHIWIYDTLGALILGLTLEKRWACKNLCAMGAFTAIGSTWSRLIPVIDTETCNLCARCESVCLVNLPLTEYAGTRKGLVTSSECILCGRCVDACSKKAIRIRFVWNRKKYREQLSQA